MPGNRLWIPICLAFGPAVSNGIGRFAYALILPAMRDDLGWSYTQAGWVNTANALGYLVGAAAMLRLVSRLGPRRLFDLGMVVTAGSLVASGLPFPYPVLLGLRALTGLAGAFAFIGGGALVAHGAPSSIALYFAGGGAGILLTGAGLPWLFELHGAHAWGQAWIGLGLLSLVLAAPALAASARVEDVPAPRTRAPWRRRRFVASLAAYFLFAIGSIVYMTFVVAWMRARGASAGAVSLVWGALGAAIVASPVPWRRMLARGRGGRPLAASIAGCAVGAALPLVDTSLATMLASAVVFGGAFFIPPAAVTALARHELPAEAWGSAIATYTFVFGVGQPIGPLLAGAIADATGSLHAGLAAAAAALVAAAIAAAAQP
jgi:predicted MFS family arabinose efflux permease